MKSLRNFIRIIIENVEQEIFADVPIDALQDGESFRRFLARLQRQDGGREKIQAMQNHWNNLNQQLEDEQANKFRGMVQLFHSTSPPVAKKIMAGGFELTTGLRQGILGGNSEVQNLAIFTTDDKAHAQAYGNNRTSWDQGNVGVTLDVRADINNTLDLTNWKAVPRDIKRLCLQMISEWEGEKIRRPRQHDYFWFIDQPEIVDLIKSKGYDSVRFAESTRTKKEFGLTKDAGDTIAIFDPKKVHVVKDVRMHLGDFIQYIRSSKESE
jgi:hypothetical protein